LFRLFLAGSVYGVTFNGHCFSEIWGSHGGEYEDGCLMFFFRRVVW
jgi:hypothetical protein